MKSWWCGGGRKERSRFILAVSLFLQFFCNFPSFSANEKIIFYKFKIICIYDKFFHCVFFKKTKKNFKKRARYNSIQNGPFGLFFISFLCFRNLARQSLLRRALGLYSRLFQHDFVESRLFSLFAKSLKFFGKNEKTLEKRKSVKNEVFHQSFFLF